MTGQPRLARAAAAPVALVTLIAGVVSYSHIAALGMRTHQGWADSHLLPFAVDFLIVAGSVILLAGYWPGWLCVAAGVTGTLFANLEFGLPYGWLSAMVSTWPAVAFTVATFVLERWLRYQRRATPAVTRGTAAVTPLSPVCTELNLLGRMCCNDLPCPHHPAPAVTPAGTPPVMAHANGNGARPARKPTNEELAAAQGVSVRTLQRRRNGTAKTP